MLRAVTGRRLITGMKISNSYLMVQSAAINMAVIFCLVLALPLTGTAAELPRTGQRTCFDQTGQSIDHTDSGQDGDLQTGSIWPEPRFIDNGDGTVTDQLTGLMWMFDGRSLGKMSWQAAMQGGALLQSATKEPDNRIPGLKAEYADWFLPDIRQLETLFNGEEPYLHNWLNSWGFKNIQADSYWSATVSPNPYTAWIFRFNSGVAEQAAKIDKGFVLLARQAAPAAAADNQNGDDSTIAATGRFIDNGDGTITDTTTALMWLQDASCLGTADWQAGFTKLKSYNSNQAAYKCGANSYTDWHVPNRHELRSLIDHNTDLPALPASHPFTNVQPDYWTATTAAANPSQAYKIFMGSGELQVGNKETQQHIWPVRPAGQQAPGERLADQTQPPVYTRIHAMFRPSGDRIKVSWPAVRFADQGDGTLIDNRSGLMWLKDAQCLGKRQWPETAQTIERLNQYPHRVGCKEYTKAYDDWQLPDLTTLAELTEGAEPATPADWLTQQGATAVPARDYWSVTENPLNLYYAWAINFKEGTPRNYAKKFPLFVWPVRMLDNKGWVHPKPLLTVNNQKNSLRIMQGDSFTLAAAIADIDNVMKADFKIWYEAPDSSQWWLSSSGTWEPEEKVLHHGNLFPLEAYPVFSGRTTEMATGYYTMHFDISILLDPDDTLPLFPTTFSTTFALYIDTGMIDQIKVLWNPQKDNYIGKTPLGFFPQLPPNQKKINKNKRRSK